MTRTGRKRRDRVTVEQLLKETGAQARTIGLRGSTVDQIAMTGRPGIRLAREVTAGRSRVERRTDEKAGSGPAGSRTRRKALISGALTVLAAAVLLAAGLNNSDDSRPLPPFAPLEPATFSATSAPPSDAPLPPTTEATASRAVMPATQPVPAASTTDEPVVTATIPPSQDPSSEPADTPPPTTVTLGYQIGGNGGGRGGRHR